MVYFQVRYDSRVVIYDCKAFIRLTTGPYVINKCAETMSCDWLKIIMCFETSNQSALFQNSVVMQH